MTPRLASTSNHDHGRALQEKFLKCQTYGMVLRGSGGFRRLWQNLKDGKASAVKYVLQNCRYRRCDTQ